MVKYGISESQSLELLVNYSLLSLVEDLEQLMAHHKEQMVTRCGSRFYGAPFLNTRDVTLRRLYTIKLSQSSTLYNITSRGDTYLRGLHMVEQQWKDCK